MYRPNVIDFWFIIIIFEYIVDMNAIKYQLHHWFPAKYCSFVLHCCCCVLFFLLSDRKTHYKAYTYSLHQLAIFLAIQCCFGKATRQSEMKRDKLKCNVTKFMSFLFFFQVSPTVMDKSNYSNIIVITPQAQVKKTIFIWIHWGVEGWDENVQHSAF